MNLSSYISESKVSKQKYRAKLNRSVLSPTLSKQNVESHTKRTIGYAKRANANGNSFDVGGIELHNIWWDTLSSPERNNKPVGELAVIIDKKYGSFDKFKREWTEQALALQGSGWIALLKSGRIMPLKNHTYVEGIVMLLDMWEHSYVVDYDTNKDEYVAAMWELYDFSAINLRL